PDTGSDRVKSGTFCARLADFRKIAHAIETKRNLIRVSGISRSSAHRRVSDMKRFSHVDLGQVAPHRAKNPYFALHSGACRIGTADA
ncbi:hypothetical protein, partial [Burkholderia pseudomallei]|uniref:hypothetical protein n=1 Tax=Burkholderia pseudomallei TaxID=28450 RepID=UPI0021F7108D